MLNGKSIILAAFLFMSCSTTDIYIDNDALYSVKVIALVPFTSSYIIDPGIYKESEESFASALSRLGYKVIDIKSDSQEQHENRLTLSGKTVTQLKSEGAVSGAHALLYGKIIFHEEKTRNVFTHRSLIFRRHGSFDADDTIKSVTEFKFQIHIRVVNLSDGNVILDIKNRYFNAKKDEYMPAFATLESYRKYTLEKMEHELAEALSPIKK